MLTGRGTKKKVGESDIVMNLFILVRQAEHEMKNGDPNVSTGKTIFFTNETFLIF
jgi:hypothetical protein